MPRYYYTHIIYYIDLHSFSRKFMGDFIKFLKRRIILQYFFPWNVNLLIIYYRETIVVLAQTTKFEIILLCLRFRLHVFITNNHNIFSEIYLLPPNYIKFMCPVYVSTYSFFRIFGYLSIFQSCDINHIFHSSPWLIVVAVK